MSRGGNQILTHDIGWLWDWIDGGMTDFLKDGVKI